MLAGSVCPALPALVAGGRIQARPGRRSVHSLQAPRPPHLHAVPVLRRKGRLQRAVLVHLGAGRPRRVPWQPPPVLVAVPALHAPVQQDATRPVGGHCDQLLVGRGILDIHLQQGDRAQRGRAAAQPRRLPGWTVVLRRKRLPVARAAPAAPAPPETVKPRQRRRPLPTARPGRPHPPRPLPDLDVGVAGQAVLLLELSGCRSLGRGHSRHPQPARPRRGARHSGEGTCGWAGGGTVSTVSAGLPAAACIVQPPSKIACLPSVATALRPPAALAAPSRRTCGRQRRSISLIRRSAAVAGPQKAAAAGLPGVPPGRQPQAILLRQEELLAAHDRALVR